MRTVEPSRNRSLAEPFVEALMARKKREYLESLTITTADGKPRMVLSTEQNGLPTIEFLGEEGPTQRRICLGLNPGDQPYFCMYRRDGSPAIGIGVREDGGAGVSAYYPDGLPSLRIHLDPSGSYGIESLRPSEGKYQRPSLRINIAPSGSIIIEVLGPNEEITRYEFKNPPAGATSP